jgi:hypothetical protein
VVTVAQVVAREQADLIQYLPVLLQQPVAGMAVDQDQAELVVPVALVAVTEIIALALELHQQQVVGQQTKEPQEVQHLIPLVRKPVAAVAVRILRDKVVILYTAVLLVAAVMEWFVTFLAHQYFILAAAAVAAGITVLLKLAMVVKAAAVKGLVTQATMLEAP